MIAVNATKVIVRIPATHFWSNLEASRIFFALKVINLDAIFVPAFISNFAEQIC